jgi:hypothetical protein
MAKRFTDTDLWDKEWFSTLSCKHKCLIRFLFDKCDQSGVWSSNFALASVYIGETVTEYDIEILSSRVKKIGEKKYFIIDFIEFQYGVLSPACKPHIKIIGLLEKHNIDSKGYTKGIQRVQEEDKDKEEEEEEERGLQGENLGWKVMAQKEQVDKLPEMKVNICIEFIKITKKIDVPAESIIGMWAVFKEQNLTGSKYYKDIDAVYSHFINWIKTQKFETNEQSGIIKKLGTSDARIAALRNW